MDQQAVEERVAVALETLKLNDDFLLEYDAQEETITSKLASYMVPLFPRYHVDVEYSLHGINRKRVVLPPSCRSRRIAEGESTLVLPDLVVHTRGHDEDNLLALEIKKTTNHESRDCDRAKLAAYRLEFGYKYLGVLDIPTGPSWRSTPWPLIALH